jgi:hypothetical protein
MPRHGKCMLFGRWTELLRSHFSSLVKHACKSRYLGGGDRRMEVQASLAKLAQDPILKAKQNLK